MGVNKRIEHLYETIEKPIRMPQFKIQKRIENIITYLINTNISLIVYMKKSIYLGYELTHIKLKINSISIILSEIAALS